jgi:hypothetical protein
MNVSDSEIVASVMANAGYNNTSNIDEVRRVCVCVCVCGRWLKETS